MRRTAGRVADLRARIRPVLEFKAIAWEGARAGAGCTGQADPSAGNQVRQTDARLP